jgi:hypothetical protein
LAEIRDRKLLEENLIGRDRDRKLLEENLINRDRDRKLLEQREGAVG